MHTYREYLEEFQSKGKAIGHFNISTVEVLHAIAAAARACEVPVLIGVSEGERDFIGVKQVVALVESIRKEYAQPIFLNADHTYTVERVKEAIDAGFDSVIFDGASLPLEENISATKACVEYAHKSGKDILVEAELGYIGTSSKLLDELPEGAAQNEMLTTADQAADFVSQTGVDLFAPAVGNIHGKLKHAANPRLAIDRIKEIHEAIGVSLVLHGGSGIVDEDFVAAAAAGMNVVHLNTEIRELWRNALKEELATSEEVAPYKLLAPSQKAVQVQVESRLRLFAGL